MAEALFRVFTTPAFDRQARKVVRNKRELAEVLDRLLAVLRTDPYNVTGKHKIKKLSRVRAGEGQWRIRYGDYRARYDIAGAEVVLHSFRDRKDAYR